MMSSKTGLQKSKATSADAKSTAGLGQSGGAFGSTTSPASSTPTSSAPPVSIDKEQRMELIKRMLGLRHKLKVHETMKAPESHEEMSQMLVGKWELEDQIRAIEHLLKAARATSVSKHRQMIEREYLGGGDAQALKRTPR